ncbi:MAG TPA: sugar phosphate nucleotidyltransferase [Steroidobacteraceae bacterium]|jgi:glucose-1-phosphate cytidylyltransferase|nr:sugar phosphate nucleotidyltransferase [Steroidobacteraceae bacterium]
MKVVLFCGGLGTRLREHSDTIPKPLVNIGHRPILWHLMRYYSHFGHKDFVLCLGYRGDLVREYFLNYRDEMTNDFVLSEGGRKVELLSRDFDGWRITFVDTGMHSNIGQRLLRVRKYVENEPMFLANYADGLSDVPMNDVIANFERTKAVATFASVRSSQSFHTVRAGADGMVTGMGAMNEGQLWINGGYFALRQEIFDYINEGDELVDKPFARLVEQGRLATYQHTGFWQSMDTFKDKIVFDRMEAQGKCPWVLWKK